jgi:hypothetical protein
VYAVDTFLFYNRFIFLESYAILILGLAFRMESLFRLLLHEQSLVHEEHPDPKLLLSIDYHRRDLATTLETAKWQVVINVDSPHPLFVCLFFFFSLFFFFLSNFFLLLILVLSLISWKILKERSAYHL